MLKGPREKTHYSNSEYGLQISRNFYLVTVEPEDERRLLVTVVDLARQVEHAADVDKHLAVAQDPGRWHCKRERERESKMASFVLLQSREKATKLSECERQL